MNTMVRHHPLPMGQSMGLDYVSVLKQNYKIIIINRAAFINLNCSHNKTLLKLSDGNRKPTDVEIFLPKPVEKKNQTGNCIM